jgi:signal transduction histidine kinase
VHEVRFQHLDIVVVDERGSVVAMSEPYPGEAQPAPARSDSPELVRAIIEAADREPAVSTLRRDDGPHRILVRTLPVGDVRFRLAGVYPLTAVEATLQRIRQLFLVAIPLLIVAAATGGWFLAKRSLAPVSSMASRAEAIGASTLHERLPVVAEDELGTLARVLNDLLDRLERSFAQQRRFMADASHELRTPAAILLTEADVTLSREHRSEAEYRESMHVIRDAARRLGRIVEDIFLLARTDAGHLVARAEQLYLEDIVHDTVRAVRPIAEARSASVELEGQVEAPLVGDPDLLGRVLLNLLDNAIKVVKAYSPTFDHFFRYVK